MSCLLVALDLPLCGRFMAVARRPLVWTVPRALRSLLPGILRAFLADAPAWPARCRRDPLVGRRSCRGRPPRGL